MKSRMGNIFCIALFCLDYNLGDLLQVWGLSKKTIGVGNPSYKEERACPFTTVVQATIY
jgi:hypothetical protein